MSSNDGLGQFIASPDALAAKILDWKARGFHVLSPAIQMATFAPGYGVNASLVLLDYAVDADGGGLDTYFDKATMEGDLGRAPIDSDERAPSKVGLNKISAAAGVSWVETTRKDPLTIQNLWIYQVTGVYLAYDGTPQTIQDDKEIDYRDGSAQIGEWTREAWAALLERNRHLPQGAKAEWTINGWSEKRVRQARCNGAERALTGARERAIRTLGIKHVYTVGELKRPFVALRVCPLIDMRDPEVRRAVVAGQLAGVASLYAGAGEPRRLTEGPMTIDVTPRREREPVAQTAPAVQQTTTSQTQQERPNGQKPADDQTRAATEEERQAVARAREEAAKAKAPSPADVRPEDEEAMADLAQREAELPPGAVYVRQVDRASIPYSQKHEKFGQSFTKYAVVDSNGSVYVTVFPKWGQKAEAARDSHAPVVIRAQTRTFNGRTEEEILNIADAPGARAAADPQLPLEAAGQMRL